LSPLEQYVRARVLQLLEAAKAKERQFVRLGGQLERLLTGRRLHRIYYSPDMEGGSEDPADLEKTTRVLTVMRADKY
jgi:hypothetical protein